MENDFVPDDDGLVMINVGSRLHVKVKVLNGAEVRRADLMSRGTDIDRAHCRAAYAVRNINGDAFGSPKNDGDLDRVMGRFTGRGEWDAFVILYGKSNQDDDLEEQVKNLLGTP